MSKQPRVASKQSQFNRRMRSNSSLKLRRRNSKVENDSDYDPLNRPRNKSTTRFIEVSNQTKKTFSWEQYLNEENAVAISPDILSRLVLTDPIPKDRNKFEVGWLLEAVDPEHQSLIGLVSVVNVIGQRLRLHFEGFSSIYDFWVYIDSPFIFPCGFSSKTGRRFAPPLGFEADNFDWKSYAISKGLQIAPDDAFSNVFCENKTGFKVFDRVEAVDRQHPELICVATISDTLGDFVLVHFDGWNSYYDYWTPKTSNYIKPVGWCSENNKNLSPPLDLGEQQFCWEIYLKSKEARAADPSCFSSEVHGFEIGMKLEVVDPRNLIVTRVASIVDVEDFRILIHFDGWSDLYNVWMDIDSRDLHPCGWSEKTGEILLTPFDKKEVDFDQDSCSVSNCLGHGHIRHDRFISHHSDFGCPYSPQNLNREPLSDRLSLARTSTLYENVIADFNNHTKPDSIIVAKKRRGRPRSCSHFNNSRHNLAGMENTRRIRQNISDDVKSGPSKKIRLNHESNQHHSSRLMIFEAAYIASVMEKKHDCQPPSSWHNHVFSLPEIRGKTANDIILWTIDQVASFVEQLTGKSQCAEAIRKQEIDGKAFLMLTQSDIVTIMKLKLGPGLKISNAILSINQKYRSNSY